ncbi:unnamed protein product [Chrysoparadoxa australica]
MGPRFSKLCFSEEEDVCDPAVLRELDGGEDVVSSSVDTSTLQLRELSKVSTSTGTTSGRSSLGGDGYLITGDEPEGPVSPSQCPGDVKDRSLQRERSSIRAEQVVTRMQAVARQERAKSARLPSALKGGAGSLSQSSSFAPRSGMMGEEGTGVGVGRPQLETGRGKSSRHQFVREQSSASNWATSVRLASNARASLEESGDEGSEHLEGKSEGKSVNGGSRGQVGEVVIHSTDSIDADDTATMRKLFEKVMVGSGLRVQVLKGQGAPSTESVIQYHPKSKCVFWESNRLVLSMVRSVSVDSRTVWVIADQLGGKPQSAIGFRMRLAADAVFLGRCLALLSGVEYL